LHSRRRSHRRIETAVLEEWLDADAKGNASFPHEFMFSFAQGKLKKALPD